jgi:hypothetical protein
MSAIKENAIKDIIAAVNADYSYMLQYLIDSINIAVSRGYIACLIHIPMNQTTLDLLTSHGYEIEPGGHDYFIDWKNPRPAISMNIGLPTAHEANLATDKVKNAKQENNNDNT